MRNKGKVDKTMEIKRSTMSEMRLLGKLLIAFAEEDSSLTGEDMFLRRNFAKLEGAIDKVTLSESCVDHGLQESWILINKVFNGDMYLYAAKR